ncbi:unnamed protein product [Ascophyllum nodosum]
MKLTIRILLVACTTLSCLTRAVESKRCGSGEDMPSGSKVRIGVMHRPEDCSRRSSIGDRLTMHYEGLLYKDCKEFDSSRGRGPFSFTLGKGEVIKGWDSGLLGMCEGEKRRLTIPSEYGYGSQRAGADIHPGATLVFDVELLNIK